MTEQPTPTTPDNPEASSNTADNPLHKQLADALINAAISGRRDYQIYPGLGSAPGPFVITGNVDELADAVAAAILPTTRLLGELARSSDADVKRVITLYERWVKSSMALGIVTDSTALHHWWEERLAELHDAILPPDHTAGPSVAEAAADDRRYWECEKDGAEAGE